jgi:iron complex transport system ATP-binding protein
MAMTTGGEGRVELRDLTFSYNHKAFIENFNADFEPGSLTSIIGPNGCGKSTLVQLIDGLLKPSSGEARIDGQATLSLSPKERARRLAVLAQSTRPPAMTVNDLVACGRYPYHSYQSGFSAEDHQMIDSALAATGITELRDHDIRRLSGGERQKAFVAMILAQDTRIIVLDEPTTYLDIHACHELMGLIHQQNCERDITIIMVIHDLDLALRYSEHILVMERGQVRFHGTVEETLASGSIEEAFHVDIRETTGIEGRSFSLFPV